MIRITTYSNYGNYYKKTDRAKKRKEPALTNGKTPTVSTRKTDFDSDEF